MSAPSTDSRQSGQANEKGIGVSTLITALSKRRHIHGGPIVGRLDECNRDITPLVS
jgi:hypothetical protein